MTKWNRKGLIVFVLTAALAFSFFAVLPVLAVETGLDATATASGLNTGSTSGNLTLIIAGVIKQIITLLGLVLVGLFIYGGIKWMIARDNEDDVKEAKETIKNAVIGLVIILASYAITQYVISAAMTATTGAQG